MDESGGMEAWEVIKIMGALVALAAPVFGYMMYWIKRLYKDLQAAQKTILEMLRANQAILNSIEIVPDPKEAESDVDEEG